MAKQLHIFVENRPGRLEVITENLNKANIDIKAFAIQDRTDYGLMKLLVDKPQDAYLSLADLGCACALRDVLAVSVPDKRGNLHKLLSVLSKNNINIIDAHGFVLQPSLTGICILEIENLAQSNAEQAVKEAGFEVLEDSQLYNL